MSSRHGSLARAAAALFVSTVLLQGCATTGGAPASVVALPNGYYLQRASDSNVGLVQRGGRNLVRGPIAAYAVNHDLVAGCVGQWPARGVSYPNEMPYPDSPECRYFILDTPTGKLEANLDPGAWRARLKELGAPENLKITAPVLPPV